MDEILRSFSLTLSDFSIERIGSGHIHETFKLKGKISYILQRVNKNVFKEPEAIASNIRLASDFLKEKNPEYCFVGSILTKDGSEMAYDHEGFPWRLFPYRENTITLDWVSTEDEAFNAAAGFAELTRLLDSIDESKFQETIPRFHDLSRRYQQFIDSLKNSTSERRQNAEETISCCKSFYFLVENYEALLNKNVLRKRVTHNDTKINNILFDEVTHKVAGVIDLDTLMPGYFIYDLGDMVRTFVSPVSEEEQDISKIVFRRKIYDALLEGYKSQLGSTLTSGELSAIPFAGKMMTFIMALRFMTDFLNNDVYYHTSYPDQNLVRAKNQLEFLRKLEAELK
ncbi:MAG: aminoglycoside phosphotransferase family protein [Cyclobacteriaceae bacterium]|nr:aminoglycoside phosphotransferase family protein [Cyclobacteriaceae bacterium]